MSWVGLKRARHCGSGTRPGSNSEEPDYFIPAGTHFTVTIEGEGLTATDDTSVGVIGDAYDLTVDGIQLHPGGQQTIDPAADGSSISYSFTGAQSPVISLGASYPGSYPRRLHRHSRAGRRARRPQRPAPRPHPPAR